MRMREQSIRPLVAALEESGRLKRVTQPVDPDRDMAAVALKAHRERNLAVLFEDARGMRAAAQILAERAQWAAALGVPLPDLLGWVQLALRACTKPSFQAASRLERADMTLARLPIARASAGCAAPQMSAVAIALDPATGSACLGLTRHHVAAPDRLSVMDLPPALERVRRRLAEQNRAMTLALVIGADPALILAAALGTWRAADLGLAGSLAGAPMRLMRDAASGLPLPAEAEFVIVGEMPVAETVPTPRLATPFGTHAEATACPAFVAHTVLARAHPIFHAMQAGPGGDHAGALNLAAAALVAEHVRNIEGGIDFIDIVCPTAAGAQVVVVKLKARVEGQAKTALMGALSGPVNTLKLAIAVDEDVDPADLRDVFWSVASRTHAEIDVGMIDGLRAHALDFAAPFAGDGPARLGTRWFIDSTMPPLTQAKRREDFARAIPRNLAATDLARFLPE
jgi:2,5-furandicarboxylate decarboxylase 1